MATSGTIAATSFTDVTWLYEQEPATPRASATPLYIWNHTAAFNARAVLRIDLSGLMDPDDAAAVLVTAGTAKIKWNVIGAGLTPATADVQFNRYNKATDVFNGGAGQTWDSAPTTLRDGEATPDPHVQSMTSANGVKTFTGDEMDGLAQDAVRNRSLILCVVARYVIPVPNDLIGYSQIDGIGGSVAPTFEMEWTTESSGNEGEKGARRSIAARMARLLRA